MQSRDGLTLLEVMIALVILSLVGTAYLQIFSDMSRVTGATREWTAAIAYAEQGMEEAKLHLTSPTQPGARRTDAAPGYERSTIVTEWQAGLRLATVTVRTPDGRRFEVKRLIRPQ